MTAVVAISAVAIIAISAIGLSVSFLLLSQKKSLNHTEELALRLSSELNRENWIGNMNNMTGFSRELVFLSRDDLNKISQKHPRLKPLAMQLMEESRSAAQLVNDERKSLILAKLKSMQVSTQKAETNFQVQKNRDSMPIINAENVEIVNVDAGYIEGIASNVYLSDGVPELKDYDVQTNYANQNSKVLNANIDARLPAPDNDLEFQIASLPAPVKASLSPARLTANSVFRRIIRVKPNTEENYAKCNQLPSAIQIDSTVGVSSFAAKDIATGAIKIKVSAAAAGATLSLP